MPAMIGPKKTYELILTGEPAPQQIVNAIRGRAYSYFHKPLPPAPLTDMVQQALDASIESGSVR